MTLNSSGPISVGGSVAGQSINLELGRAATASSNLNEAVLRSLAQVLSGAISMYNFYGKSRGGQIAFSNQTTNWTVPSGVTSICAVCIGAGASGFLTGIYTSGGGGALSYTNNIAVTPGEVLQVVAGSGGSGGEGGGESYISRSGTTLILAAGGDDAYFSGSYGGLASSGVGAVRYSGGDGATGFYNESLRPGGGGAAGYYGNGGTGSGRSIVYHNLFGATAGSGGGGGGGGLSVLPSTFAGAGGGGTGYYGYDPYMGWAGSDGTTSQSASGGGGGSSGSGGASNGGGGAYGGGAGSTISLGYDAFGGHGAVRIIWGSGRAFPSTNTQDI